MLTTEAQIDVPELALLYRPMAPGQVRGFHESRIRRWEAELAEHPGLRSILEPKIERTKLKLAALDARTSDARE